MNNYKRYFIFLLCFMVSSIALGDTNKDPLFRLTVTIHFKGKRISDYTVDLEKDKITPVVLPTSSWDCATMATRISGEYRTKSINCTIWDQKEKKPIVQVASRAFRKERVCNSGNLILHEGDRQIILVLECK